MVNDRVADDRKKVWLINGDKLYEEAMHEYRRANYCDFCLDTTINLIDDAPTVDAIPIAVMKRAITGIDAADQCDQAGRCDFELRAALKTVLKWYGTPAYKEYERRTYDK